MIEGTRVLGRLAAGALAGLAAWCSLGLLALDGVGPAATRLGLLPPWWLLAGLAAAGAGLTVRLRAPWWAVLALASSACTVLPWLPLPVPAAFLAWTAPAAWWIWAGVLAVFVVALAPALTPAAVRRLLADPRRAVLVAFAAALVLYLGAAWRLAAVFPGGDEPHYLVITQSLLQDADLQIENNYRQHDYLAYFRLPLAPHFLQRGVNGQIYSIHAPGLPALVAPAFALAGYRGVEVFLALLAALVTALTWRVGFVLGGSAAAAWAGWAALALSAPFVFHAFAVYPEVAGSLMIMVGVLALVGSRAPGDASGSRRAAAWFDRPSGALAAGAALAALPWLHTRYAAAAGLLGICLAARIAVVGRRRLVRLMAFLSLPIASAAGWFTFFRVVYGTFSPAAPYGLARDARLEYIPVGFPALLLDQQFGLIPNAPVYLFGFIGLFALLRRRWAAGTALVTLAVGSLAVAAAYRMWWGGWSAPARFTVPVLPVVAAGVAAGWGRGSRAARALVGAALFGTILLTLTMVFGGHGWLIFNDRNTPGARWLEWLSPAVNLPYGLGSFIRGRPEPALGAAAVWAAALGLTWLALRGLATRIRSREGLAAVLAILLPLAAMASLSAVWTFTGARRRTPTSAQIDLLEHVNPTRRPVGVVYRPFRLVPPDAVVREIALATSARYPRARGDVALLALERVPAGTYILWAGSGVGWTGGRLDVGLRRDFRPVLGCGVGDVVEGRGRCVLRLPVTVRDLQVQGDAQALRSLHSVVLRPVRVDPAGTPRETLVAARAALLGSMAVYPLDDSVFLEEHGMWVTGGSRALIGLAPAGPAPFARLTVRNGGADNYVAFAAGDWHSSLTLGPFEARTVDVPVDPVSGTVVLSVRSDRGFVPAQVDPRSADTRYLGCWIEEGAGGR